MIKKLFVWYSKLPLIKQLIVSFISNWIWTFAGWLIGDKIFFDTPHSMREILFKSTFSACTFTALFIWGKRTLRRRQIAIVGHQNES